MLMCFATLLILYLVKGRKQGGRGGRKEGQKEVKYPSIEEWIGKL